MTLQEKFDEEKAAGIREGIEIGKAEGKAEGMKEGKNSKAREICLNLLKKGIDIPTIIEVSGLSEFDILKMKKNL